MFDLGGNFWHWRTDNSGLSAGKECAVESDVVTWRVQPCGYGPGKFAWLERSDLFSLDHSAFSPCGIYRLNAAYTRCITRELTLRPSSRHLLRLILRNRLHCQHRSSKANNLPFTPGGYAKPTALHCLPYPRPNSFILPGTQSPDAWGRPIPGYAYVFPCDFTLLHMVRLCRLTALCTRHPVK